MRDPRFDGLHCAGCTRPPTEFVEKYDPKWNDTVVLPTCASCLKEAIQRNRNGLFTALPVDDGFERFILQEVLET